MTSPYRQGNARERGDCNASIHSDSPLQTGEDGPSAGGPGTSYPPDNHNNTSSHGFRHVQLPADDAHSNSPYLRNYDAERAMMYPDGPGSMPLPPSATPSNANMMPDATTTDPREAYHRSRNNGSRNGSWDLLAGIRKFEHSYEEFDTRNASEAHLAFAEGDMPKNKVRVAVGWVVRGN